MRKATADKTTATLAPGLERPEIESLLYLPLYPNILPKKKTKKKKKKKTDDIMSPEIYDLFHLTSYLVQN